MEEMGGIIMITIKITKGFNDLTLLKEDQDYEEERKKRTLWRNNGAVITLPYERGIELINAGYAILLEMSKKSKDGVIKEAPKKKGKK